MSHARRVKEVRARARVQRWGFRQRALARGAWDRFRLALALARDAYAIDEQTHADLLAEGFRTDDAGAGLEPARRIVWITEARAATLATPKLAMHLDAAMLATTCLALVPFTADR
ncbi:MAG: hypothetical protein F9K40_15045 [Kofleriaceae bacterium]|nr:MAG: hypothetical protein F9K40_15045 [Kofleriaceae bacterium]MBZ0118636.1 hypothetical protein [Sandaracinaceae bacterium]